MFATQRRLILPKYKDSRGRIKQQAIDLKTNYTMLDRSEVVVQFLELPKIQPT